MDPNEYQKNCLRTMADQEKIWHRVYMLGPKATQLDIGSRGLSADVGEVESAIQRHLEYGQPLDVINLIEELGDCCYRIAQIADAVGVPFGNVLRANNLKLEVRYKAQFSNSAAEEKNRDRAAERKALEEAIGNVLYP